MRGVYVCWACGCERVREKGRVYEYVRMMEAGTFLMI